MVSYRLLTFLFILSNVSEFVIGAGTGNQDEVPCEDETKAVPITTEGPTTTGRPCQKYPGSSAYKRQNGWWCSKLYFQDIMLSVPMDYQQALRLCSYNNYPFVSSLETDEEKRDYAAIPPALKVNAYWVNVGLNKTNGRYYWSDGYSVPTLDPQPTVIDPNGKGAWTINRDPSVPGSGSVSIVQINGTASTNVRAVICGGPGLGWNDETKTVPTTTTEGPTTTRRPCQKFSGTTAYRRQSGWWCSKMFYQDMQLNAPISYERGVGLCTMNKLPYVSSLETEKEKTDYAWLAPTVNVYALWVNITFDTTKGVYEWGDEHSVPTIDPQPKVIDPNGKGVYTINNDPSVPGPGSLSIVQTNGTASTMVRGIVCGGPGDN
ncbi:unnamed protein product [Caenorhabditis brenneri]